ncbi:class I SAM-dependent methyltransferase [uncultured Phenylobacterium sp.]|uniref:class I SAM-dependent methyltransferase n=1 Tax=uncultured Phenylobacterium sp. TaxID=349273 RepID=UPI0026007500|nr:class I SAM-dependent methyltransferase [uncultured Phenylobacterium sp.]
MGDRNQIIFLQRFAPVVSGPILEIGSKDYGSTSSFREIYPDCPYIGIDMAPGAGVDAVVDLEAGIGPLPERHFQLAVCCSVLEHVAKPWKMAENITRVVAPGGRLYMSVPWVWRYHPYPDDYFRFSFRGIISLFPEFVWDVPHYSTNVEGELIAVTEDNKGADNAMAKFAPREDGKAPRKYLPYLMVNMLGVRR